jgi:hypothetical protein
MISMAFVKPRKALSPLIPILILAGMAAGALAPGQVTAAPDEPVDGYGYTYSVESRPWVDANAGTLLTFPSQNDACAGPLDIGFEFHFYERTYATLYVSTNGLVTFGEGTLGLQPKPMPWASAPNNLVAPLWSGLDLTFGRVYLLTAGVTPSRSTVIEWEIYDRNPADPGAVLTLNFELVLYEDGGIQFQYNVLDGLPPNYRIGIEDSQGVNGLQYLTALAVGSDLRFIRPTPGPRVKVLPRFQGSFIYDVEAQYRVDIKNNGDNGADVYNLAVASASPGWQASFYDHTGQVLLGDTNGDLHADTGSLTQGAGLSVVLKVAAPAVAQPGDYTTLVYTATSTLDPSRWMTGTVQTAIPLQFTQVYADSGRGIRLGQFWQANSIDRTILSSYPGANLSMEAISADDYLVAWETSQNTLAAITDFYTDIHYKIASRFGGTSPVMVLTNGAQLVDDPDITQADATQPAIARASDGRLGVAWSQSKRRSIPAGGSEENSNVFFAILDNSGTRLSERFNVTQDSSWFSGGHTYVYPNIAVTTDGHYLVCWVDKFSAGQRLRCASHTYGQQISQTGVTQVAAAANPTILMRDLWLEALADNHVLITYAEAQGDTTRLLYAVVDSAGALDFGPAEITGASGIQPRAVQLASDDILLAWININRRVEYAYLDSSYNLGASHVLTHISGRAADSLSATLAPGGLAVLTWVDQDDQDYLFYTVLDQEQNLVTPPQIFLSDPFGDPQYQTSAFGFGNAGYLGVHQRYIPLVRR